MKPTHKITLVVLAVFSLIILLPPIIYGYVYPSAGDDSAEHMRIIGQIDLSNPFSKSVHYLYAGQWIVGLPLVAFGKITGLNLPVTFLWFNYLVFIGVVITYYLIFSRLFNQLTGIIAIILGVFLSIANLGLFYAGSIFSIINVEIIMMWLLYFAIMAITKRNGNDAFIGGLLGCLFAWFHPSGYYLPIIVLGIVVCSVLWRKWLSKFQYGQGMLMIAFLVLLSSILWVSSYTKLNGIDSTRQITDALVLTAPIGAGLLGMLLIKVQVRKPNYPKMVLACLVVLAAIWTMPVWFSYTSAVKEPDKQAIAYIKTLNSSSFYCSENVPYWLYEVYTGKHYNTETGKIYIDRSEPMTLRTTKGYVEYWNPKEEVTRPPSNIKESRKFSEGRLNVYVIQGN